jgi:hypothetical protein
VKDRLDVRVWLRLEGSLRWGWSEERVFRGDLVRRNACLEMHEDCHDRASQVDYLPIRILDRGGILLREGYHRESRSGPGCSSAGHVDLLLDGASMHRCTARAGLRQANKVSRIRQSKGQTSEKRDIVIGQDLG